MTLVTRAGYFEVESIPHHAGKSGRDARDWRLGFTGRDMEEEWMKRWTRMVVRAAIVMFAPLSGITGGSPNNTSSRLHLMRKSFRVIGLGSGLE